MIKARLSSIKAISVRALEARFAYRAKAILASCLIFVLLTGCGDEGLREPHGKTTLPPLDTRGFNAIDFPTGTGTAWTYVNVDTNQEFTVRIEGTRDIGGTTHRELTISEMSPVEPDTIPYRVVEHLAANAYYLRIDSDFYDAFPFPISATYFFKTADAMIESAFDAYVFVLDNATVHQKHSPARLLWEFPLEVGKEWVVFDKTVGTSVQVTRTVVEKDTPLRVPAGTYSTYVVYEEVIYGDSSDSSIFLIGPPAIYWLAPSVGVVQYRYTRFRNTDTLLTQTFALKNVHLPEPNAD